MTPLYAIPVQSPRALALEPTLIKKKKSKVWPIIDWLLGLCRVVWALTGHELLEAAAVVGARPRGLRSPARHARPGTAGG